MYTLCQQRFDQHALLSVNLETNFRCQLDNISMQCNRLHQEFIKQIEEVHGSVQLEVQCAKSTLAKYSDTRSPRNRPANKYTKLRQKPRGVPVDVQTALRGKLTSDEWLSNQQ